MSKSRRIVFSGRTLVDPGPLAEVKEAVDSAATSLAALEALPEAERKRSEAYANVVAQFDRIARLS